MQTWLKVLISILSALGLFMITVLVVEGRSSDAETEKMLAIADKVPVKDDWNLWREEISPDPFITCLQWEPCNTVRRRWNLPNEQLSILEYKKILDESGWDLQLDERTEWNEACKLPREQVSEPDDNSEFCTWVATDGDYEIELTLTYYYHPKGYSKSDIMLELSR